MTTPLFRPEALKDKSGAWFGNAVLIQPISIKVFATFSVLCTILAVIFITTVSYTKRVKVFGLLLPTSGLVSVQTTAQGTVVERRVNDGDFVKAGQILFVISTELQTLSNSGRGDQINSNQEIISLVRSRQRSMAAEQKKSTRSNFAQISQLNRDIESLRSELRAVDAEMLIQQGRVELQEKQFEIGSQMQKQGFISYQGLHTQTDRLFELRASYQSMVRNRISLVRSAEKAQAELDLISSKESMAGETFQRGITELEEQAVTTEGHRRIIITAPVAGNIAGITAEQGQAVSSQTLLTIIPEGAVLEANLYVPSRSIGFLKPGQNASLRFAAFPYQKYGQYPGEIYDVARVALNEKDIAPSILKNMEANDNIYRVRANLFNQSVTVGGHEIQLASGMFLEADIVQDKRTLFEWAFEPILKLRSSL